ncbi:MAG: tetratricopeptide repeat protein [Armatimonadota bacterium]
MTKLSNGRAPDKRVLGLFAFVLVAGIASIPWQIKQWKATSDARRQREAYEKRLSSLKSQNAEAKDIEASLAAPAVTIETRMEAARFFLSHGNSKRAAQLLQELSIFARKDASLKNDEAFHGGISSLYERIGWQDKAMEHARIALRIAPDSVPSILRVAFLEALLGWQKDCQAHVTKAKSLEPSSAEPYLASALVFEQIGSMKAAEQDLLLADSHRPGDWRIHLLLSRNRIAQGRFDDAIATLEIAAKLAPDESSITAAKVDAILGKYNARAEGQSNLLQDAEVVARHYLEQSPDSPDAQYQLGRIYKLMGRDADAIKQYEVVYAKSPDTGQLRIQYGTLLVRAGKRDLGSKILGEARKEETLGDQYMKLVTTAGQDMPNAEAHKAVARHCMVNGRIPRAILEWQHVLTLLPGDKEAIAGIAKAYKVRGDIPVPAE